MPMTELVIWYESNGEHLEFRKIKIGGMCDVAIIVVKMDSVTWVQILDATITLSLCVLEKLLSISY